MSFLFAFYNIIGINLTKLDSSISRVSIDNLRSIFIWLFFLSFPQTNVQESFHFLQLIGFLFLAFGALIYNEILVIPFCGLYLNTRKNIEKRERQKFLDDLERENDEENLFLNARSSSNLENNKNEKNQ